MTAHLPVLCDWTPAKLLTVRMALFVSGATTIRLLCTLPLARIQINSHVTETFPGTRKGCPLSPLLFALLGAPFCSDS